MKDSKSSGRDSHTRPAEKISAPVITLHLEAELKVLRSSASYKRNDHASTTVINRPGLGAVLIALPKGGHLAAHQTARPFTLSVLEGTIQVALEDRTIEMVRGDLTALAPNLKHKVTGIEDSAFLLTMGGGEQR